jgi:hypothetical protein
LHGKEESLQAKIADEHTTVGCYLRQEKLRKIVQGKEHGRDGGKVQFIGSKKIP